MVAYSKTVAVGTDGQSFYWSEELFGGKSAAYVRLKSTVAARVWFQHGAGNNFIEYAEGLTAATALEISDEPVTACIIIPTAAATVNVFAQDLKHAPAEAGYMRAMVEIELMKAKGLPIDENAIREIVDVGAPASANRKQQQQQPAVKKNYGGIL